jgi:hypothetical protein
MRYATKLEAMTHDELCALFDDMRYRLVFITDNLHKRTKRDDVVAQLELVKDCLYNLTCIAEETTTQD